MEKVKNIEEKMLFIGKGVENGKLYILPSLPDLESGLKQKRFNFGELTEGRACDITEKICNCTEVLK